MPRRSIKPQLLLGPRRLSGALNLALYVGTGDEGEGQ